MRTRYLKLYSSVPEYGAYDEDNESDMELLIGWFHGWEIPTEEQEAQFRQWLDGLQLGVVSPVPGQEDSIVKVQY